MSVNHSIACTVCRERLWVAQVNGNSRTFYSGEPGTMAELGKFLFAHRGHALVFDCTDAIESVFSGE